MEKKKLKIAVTALLAIVMVVAGVAAGYGLGRSSVYEATDVSADTQNVQSENNGLSIMSLKEDGEWIVLNTSFLTLRYPFAFSDIIEAEAYNDESGSQLRFYSVLDEKKVLNFIIHFNSNEGVLCGTLKLEQDIPVTVEFEEFPKKLSDDWQSTFYAVQETFNDVLDSMKDNDNFSAVI